MALKMTEGVLTADPKMDADKDGQVTMEDVRLILQWAVKGPDVQPTQPAGEDDQTETQKPDTVRDDQVATQKPDTTQDDQAATQEPDTLDAQALLGEWEMTRQSIQPALPPFVPEFFINPPLEWSLVKTISGPKIDYFAEIDPEIYYIPKGDVSP